MKKDDDRKRIMELESYIDDLIRYNNRLKNEINELESCNDELNSYNNQLLNVLIDQEALLQGEER